MIPTTKIPPLRVACEITADRVVAARSSEGGKTLEAAAASSLPQGALTPSLQQENVITRQALLTSLRETLGAVGARARDICLVIPDGTTRVMLLDLDTLPDKPQDADAVVRFRLKKSLPFDVEHSSLSFDRQGTSNPVRVVAAITPRPVLDEYEALVREAGFNPGSVLPATLAALGVVDASHPTMLIKAEPGTTTFAIVDQNQLLLYRSLDNGGTAVVGESLVDDVNTSLVYFEDRYNVGVDKILVTGVQSAQSLQEALIASANIRVEELVSSAMTGTAGGSVSRAALSGVAGALVA